MKRTGDSLEVRDWRTIASWLAGIGVETMLPLVLAGIAAVILAALRLR